MTTKQDYFNNILTLSIHQAEVLFNYLYSFKKLPKEQFQQSNILFKGIFLSSKENNYLIPLEKITTKDIFNLNNHFLPSFFENNPEDFIQLCLNNIQNIFNLTDDNDKEIFLSKLNEFQPQTPNDISVPIINKIKDILEINKPSLSIDLLNSLKEEKSKYHQLDKICFDLRLASVNKKENVLPLVEKLLTLASNNLYKKKSKDSILNTFYYEISTIIKIILETNSLSIFKEFTNKYNIPLNIAFPSDIHNKNQMVSLLEYSLLLNNLEVFEYLTSQKIAFTTFEFLLNDDISDDIENNPPLIHTSFENLSIFSEHQLLFLIDKNIITDSSVTLTNYQQNTLIPTENNNKLSDIFWFLLYSEHYDAFSHLYRKAKKENPFFSLHNYQKHFGFLNLYLSLIKQCNYTINSLILLILKEEGFCLYEKNKDNISAIDIIKSLKSVETSASILYYLINDNTKIVTDNDSPSTHYSYYNKSKLEDKISLSSIEQEKEANTELMKTMLLEGNLKSKLIIKDESIFNELDKKFPNFSEVISFYKGQFRLLKMSGRIHIPPVLLIGDSGIGKTHFSKTLATLLNTGYSFIDMASVTSNNVLSGSNMTWRGAKQGKILDSLLKSTTINPIVVMDELDKAKGGEWNPTLVLHQLLEEINSKEFIDEFIDFPVDASGIIYISSANNISSISETLLSRFKIFNIKPPSEEQLPNIIQNIYEQATNHTIFSTELEPSLIKELSKNSLREIKVLIEDSVSKALLELSPQEIEKFQHNHNKIYLQKEHIDKVIKKSSFGFG